MEKYLIFNFTLQYVNEIMHHSRYNIYSSYKKNKIIKEILIEL